MENNYNNNIILNNNDFINMNEYTLLLKNGPFKHCCISNKRLILYNLIFYLLKINNEKNQKQIILIKAIPLFLNKKDTSFFNSIFKGTFEYKDFQDSSIEYINLKETNLLKAFQDIVGNTQKKDSYITKNKFYLIFTYFVSNFPINLVLNNKKVEINFNLYEKEKARNETKNKEDNNKEFKNSKSIFESNYFIDSIKNNEIIKKEKNKTIKKEKIETIKKEKSEIFSELRKEIPECFNGADFIIYKNENLTSQFNSIISLINDSIIIKEEKIKNNKQEKNRTNIDKINIRKNKYNLRDSTIKNYLNIGKNYSYLVESSEKQKKRKRNNSTLYQLLLNESDEDNNIEELNDAKNKRKNLRNDYKKNENKYNNNFDKANENYNFDEQKSIINSRKINRTNYYY